MKLNEVIDFTFDTSLIQVSVSDVLPMLGDANSHDEMTVQLVNNALNESVKYVQPAGGYILKKKIPSSEITKISIENTRFDVGSIIGTQLKDAEYIAVMVSTIGSKLENAATCFMHQNQLPEGYVLNMIGSVYAEATMDFLQHKLYEEMQLESLNLTNRFSPGYCHWDVAEQFRIFSLFPANYQGISLTDSALMNPVKSVSAIIGMGKNVKFKVYKCNVCTDEFCLYRKLVFS